MESTSKKKYAYVSNRAMIDNLQMGILSSPILYVPHYDSIYIKEALADIIDKKILNITKDEICLCNPYVYSPQNDSGINYVTNLDGESEREENAENNINRLDHNVIKCKDGLYAFFERISNHDILNNIKNKNSIRVFDKGIIYVFENIIEKLDDPRIQYSLLKFIQKYEEGLLPPETTIIIIDNKPPSSIPPEIEKFIRIVNIPYPDKSARKEMLRYWLDKKGCLDGSEYSDLEEELALTLSGLTHYEVNSILRTISFSMTNGFLNKSCLRYAQQEKKRIVQKSGVLEVVDTNIQLKDVGGLDNLKADIEHTNSVYFKNLSESHDAGLTYPKGVLIIGMPGCGKSMIAKAIATEFSVNLLKLDISKLLGKYYGESEQNLQKALNIAEMSSPCVLWIDEVEKAFAGAEGKGHSDALMMRVMGQFLTWQQERDKPIYVVATANDAMRSEFMRKGRFDEVYFVDFPNKKEVKAIFKQKLMKYKEMTHIYDFSSCQSIFETEVSLDNNDDIGNLVSSMCSDDNKIRFSGAEIECVVKLSMEECFKSYKEIEEEIKKSSKQDLCKIPPFTVSYGIFQYYINEVKKYVMYLSCKKSKGNDSEKDNQDLTAIDRIYKLQEQYNLKPASCKKIVKKYALP